MNPFEGLSETVFILLQVIVLDGILSLDNAAVLGAMAAKLPKDIPVPLTPWLQRIVGKNQQEAALKAGLIGAYAGRGFMLVLAGVIITFPLLKVLGALYLLNLVAVHFDLYQKIDRYTGIFAFLDKIVTPIKVFLRRAEQKKRFFSLQSCVPNPFWRVVISIEVMDLVFSLDNVIAVVALSEHIWVIIFGVFLSIILMRFASMLFIQLIQFEPLLMHAAYVLILAIGIELILKYLNVHIEEWIQFVISMAIILGCIAIGQVRCRRIQSKKEDKLSLNQTSDDTKRIKYL